MSSREAQIRGHFGKCVLTPVLKGWFEELGEDTGPMAFPNARGKALSREGVDYLLQQAIQRAIPACPSLATKHITPHVVRHTTAMHLLQAGVDIATLACGLVMKVSKRPTCISRPIWRGKSRR